MHKSKPHQIVGTSKARKPVNRFFRTYEEASEYLWGGVIEGNLYCDGRLIGWKHEGKKVEWKSRWGKNQ